MAYLVQPADIDLAVAWWRNRADAAWADGASDDVLSSGAAYTEARDELDKVLLIARGEFARRVFELVDGAITFAAWLVITQVQIRIIHIVSAALAVGGFEALRGNAGVLANVGDAIARQYRYFDQFASGGTTAPNAPARAGMYAEAGRGTFEDVRSDVFRAAGYTEERRVLGVAEHCADCLTEAAKGWQPIGTLRAIGDSLCKTHCHCKKFFR